MKPTRFLSLRFIFILLAVIAMASLITGSMVIAQSPTASPTPTAIPDMTPSPSVGPSASPLSSPSPSPSATPTVNKAIGIVVSIASDKTSFVILSENRSQVTINIDQNTQYSQITIPSQFFSGMMSGAGPMMGGYMMGDGWSCGNDGMTGFSDALSQLTQAATFADIVVGDFVFIKGLSADNMASQVIIIKHPDIQFMQGTISQLSSSSITITPTTGDAVNLTWDGNTIFVLKGASSVQVGQEAIVIYNPTSKAAEIVAINILPPSPSPSATVSPAVTVPASPSPTPSPSPSPLPSPSPFPLASPSPSALPGPSPSPSDTVSPTAPVSPSAFTVNVMSNSTGGNYLVDSTGMTLYFTMRDGPGVSNVPEQLLTTWPIFNAPDINVPPTLNASDFGTITRSDGKPQTTFRGYPLYYYFGDKTAGDAGGNGIGGVWFVINPNDLPPSPSPSATTSPPAAPSPAY